MKRDRPTLKVKTIKKPRINPAKNTQNKLLSRSENNPVYSIIYEIKLLLSYDKNNSISDVMSSRELLSYSENDLDQVGKILSIRGLRRMAWYFLDYGAATASILQNRLGTTEPTTYRYMKDLKTFNFISLALKTRKPRGHKGGPRPDVWMVPYATTDDINDAQRLHRNLLSPNYLYAERMAQLMIDDYVVVKELTEVYRVNYIDFLRENNVKSVNIPDIVMMSIQYFKEKGYSFVS